MSWKRLWIRFAVVVIALTAVIAVATLWPREGSQASLQSDVWTCSMHPQIRLHSLGNCPSAE